MTRRPALAAAALALLAVSCTGLGGVRRATVARSADPAARPGGTLTIGIAPPASIDPGLVADDAGALVASLVCEPLVQLDPVTGEIRAGIAETVETSGRGTLVTIRLRDDVRFHDGTTLTAQDVAFSLSRVTRHDFAAPGASLLAPITGFGLINGPPVPGEEDAVQRRELAGVRPISRTALEITLAEPEGEFARALSLPLAAPVARAPAARERAFASRPVCAGPYEVAEPYERDAEAITLERSPSYYGASQAATRGGRGYADRIVFRLFEEPRDALAAFARGELDLVELPHGARRPSVRGARLIETPAPGVEFVGVPRGLEGFDDPEVRALLSRALDRAALVEEVYGGGRLPAGRFYPPSLTSGDRPASCAENVPASGAETGRAPAAMRARPAVLRVNDDFQNVALAEAIARQWRERLGLTVRVEPMPWAEYRVKATSAEGIGALFRESWRAPYPSFSAFVTPLFHSASVGSGNWARFEDAELDRRLDRVVRREVDPLLQRELWRGVEERLCRDLPLIPVTFGKDEYLVRSDRVGTASGRWFDVATARPALRELFTRGAGT